MNIEEKLGEHLKQFVSAPFLFVGSGFSRRYIGTEDWEQLLRKFSKVLPYPFERYLSDTDEDANSIHLEEVARKMAEDFYDVYWKKDGEYIESQNHNREDLRNRYSPLKVVISEYLRNLDISNMLIKNYDKELEDLKNVVVDGIITTNWDLLIEHIFEDEFFPYIGQENLLFSNPLEVGEIYKIHGCSTEPNSLVLTDTDYKRFEKNNAYLAAKLLTIFIEHPIIFIGYSLSDKNIISILQAIISCLSNEKLKQLEERLIFLTRDSDNRGEAIYRSSIVIGEQSLAITHIRTNDYSKVYKSLSKIKRKYSPKQLRQIKGQIYDLIINNDPKEQIHVIDNNKIADFSKAEIVIGMGISKELSTRGYQRISVMNLYKDIVFDNDKHDYAFIVKLTLPDIPQIKYVPLFKFLAKSGLVKDQLPQKISTEIGNRKKKQDFITNTLEKNKKKLEKQYGSFQTMGLEDLIKNVDNHKKILKYIPLLEERNIDLEDLKNYLIEQKVFLENEDSDYKRVVRFYDWLKYGRSYKA
ncbi:MULTISPECIES: SIR2 family protein [Bacillus cereus group]|uniref:SIR2 family protein n=1 Tax=Bacillus cereus group TaxID=86661 RepID=UPI001F582E07|nr:MULTISPECIES: SIR2 family protein [Bacillus cereus group]MDH8003275.1 SIR2 family protein [Bacillus cereus]